MGKTLHFYRTLGFRVTGGHPDESDLLWAGVQRDSVVLQFHRDPPHVTPQTPVFSFMSPKRWNIAEPFTASRSGPDFTHQGRLTGGMRRRSWEILPSLASCRPVFPESSVICLNDVTISQSLCQHSPAVGHDSSESSNHPAHDAKISRNLVITRLMSACFPRIFPSSAS